MGFFGDIKGLGLRFHKIKGGPHKKDCNLLGVYWGSHISGISYISNRKRIFFWGG